MRKVSLLQYSADIWIIYPPQRCQRSGRLQPAGSEPWRAVPPIRKNRWGRTLRRPSCRTPTSGEGASLVNRENRDFHPFSDTFGRTLDRNVLRFVFMTPKARAISSIDAVPLDGSMEPRVQASRWFPTRTYRSKVSQITAMRVSPWNGSWYGVWVQDPHVLGSFDKIQEKMYTKSTWFFFSVEYANRVVDDGLLVRRVHLHLDFISWCLKSRPHVVDCIQSSLPFVRSSIGFTHFSGKNMWLEWFRKWMRSKATRNSIEPGIASGISTGEWVHYLTNCESFTWKENSLREKKRSSNSFSQQCDSF